MAQVGENMSAIETPSRRLAPGTRRKSDARSFAPCLAQHERQADDLAFLMRWWNGGGVLALSEKCAGGDSLAPDVAERAQSRVPLPKTRVVRLGPVYGRKDDQ
jgi:hypothetical protein